VVTWLAQRTDKTTVATLMRCSWEAVAAIVTPVVAEHVDRTRLDHLYRTGVDEVSYRKSHRYLTAVADHEGDGAVVWAAEGKNAATLGAFYDQLGPERIDRLQAVSLDMGSAYAKATRTKAPDAPLHRPLPRHQARQRRDRHHRPVGLEPGPKRPPPSQSTPAPAASPQGRCAVPQDQAHPVGATEGPQPPQGLPASRAR
jgi:hypothetical protein